MECRDYEVTEEKIFTTEALRALRSARENFSSAVWEKTCAANDQNFVFPPVLFRIEAREQFGQHRYDVNQHFQF